LGRRVACRPGGDVVPGTGNRNALRHGATSEAVVVPLAQKHARRLLRQRGVRAADLSAIGRALLANWSRAAAALHLLDAHAAREGWLDEDGEPRGFTKLYVSMLNSERLALRAMEAHLRAAAPKDDLASYLTENYGDAS
jgi:hypothetical protein